MNIKLINVPCFFMFQIKNKLFGLTSFHLINKELIILKEEDLKERLFLH